MIHVDVVVPTLNEELAIGDCLSALVGMFSAVWVLDSSSSDRTVTIAERLGATVVPFHWNGAYPKKKQWALDNIEFTSDWVLFIDADEIVSSSLCDEIERVVDRGFDGKAAFDVELEYFWSGIRLRHGQRVVKRVLINRRKVSFPEIDDLAAPGMGEQEGHYQPRVDGDVGRLSELLLHLDPDPVSSWFSRHNRYSGWEAFLRANPSARSEVRKHRSRQGQIFERLPGKPVVLFLINYLIRSGWRDGRAGLDYALALAFYQFQIGVKVREYKARRARELSGR